MTGVRWHRETVRVKRGVISIMVGRPRKTGKRERNGRVARTYVNPKAQVAAQPHRRGVAREYREYPEAESNFGRMMLRGNITPAQYEAGMRYAGLVAAFCAVYDAPSPYPHSIDLMRVGVSRGDEIPPHIAQAIKDRYNAAFEACESAGRKAQRAVKEYAVRDQLVDGFDVLDLLKMGLDALVNHFGIDPALQISQRQK